MTDRAGVAGASREQRLRGCLLGGAVGDALGAPVEFMRWPEIRANFGENGIVALTQLAGVAHVTDDTQMTLFTVEGLIRARVGGDSGAAHGASRCVHHAYLRWLETQGRHVALPISRDGWLFGVAALHHPRAPGTTCLAALAAAEQIGAFAVNDRKGCGGVMRVAPCGFWPGDVGAAFALGSDCARLTHAHPTGHLAAGHLSAVVAGLADGSTLATAIAAANAVLATHAGHDETLRAVQRAAEQARQGPGRERLAALGRGWIAEEALAIALYCTLAEPDPLRCLALAVNHDGDSDSTGAIAGNLLGALHGAAWLPATWLDRLELRREIEKLADDYASALAGEPLPADDYPGG